MRDTRGMTSPGLSVRLVDAKDLDKIERIHQLAFASTSFGYQGEGALVRAIHDDGDALVSLVAEHEDRLVGHALFSRMVVEADGVSLRGAALAPVGVLPEIHGLGVGSALIRRGLEVLREQAAQISFVLGNPGYYSRFGYSVELAQPYASPYAGPHFMALHLDASLVSPRMGRAAYAPAFSRS